MKTVKTIELYDPLADRPISLDELQAADDETQTEVMRHWFYERYEDPAENTPHDSSEGGYFYLWGGPYDAMDILSDNFCEIVRESVIEELVSELGDLSSEWASKPSAEDFDDYLVESIVLNTKFHHYFEKSISYIEILLDSKVNVFAEDRFLRLLYANVITSLEAYLSDAFIQTVFSEEKYLREFVENDPELKKEKFPLSEVYQQYDKIREKSKTYLMKVSWHNLARIKKMYEHSLGIVFPKEDGFIFRAIENRHNIVHRNGFTKDGGEVTIEEADVRTLMSKVKEFVSTIDSDLSILKGNVVKKDN